MSAWKRSQDSFVALISSSSLLWLSAYERRLHRLGDAGRPSVDVLPVPKVAFDQELAAGGKGPEHAVGQPKLFVVEGSEEHTRPAGLDRSLELRDFLGNAHLAQVFARSVVRLVAQRSGPEQPHGPSRQRMRVPAHPLGGLLQPRAEVDGAADDKAVELVDGSGVGRTLDVDLVPRHAHPLRDALCYPLRRAVPASEQDE